MNKINENKKDQQEYENMTLEMKDFIKIFGSDSASNKIAEALRQDYNFRLEEKARIDAIKKRPKRESIMYKTPISSFVSLQNDSASSNFKNSSPGNRQFSIAYKTQDQLIEFPLSGKGPSWMKLHSQSRKQPTTFAINKGTKQLEKIQQIAPKNEKSLFDQIGLLTPQSPKSPYISNYSPPNNQPVAFDSRMNVMKTNANSTQQQQKQFNKLERKKSQRKSLQSVPIAQQIKLVQEWWKEIHPLGKYATVHPISRVVDFLIKKKIVKERERARKLIIEPLLQSNKYKNLNEAMNVQDIFFEDFKRIFTRGIFREAVLNITSSVQSQLSGSLSDLPMTLKIINYQRKLMLGGLTNDQRGSDILNSLHQYEDLEAAQKINFNKKDTDRDEIYRNDHMWVKSALQKGVNPKIIATLGGNGAQETLAKIRQQEARKGEIAEITQLQIVPSQRSQQMQNIGQQSSNIVKINRNDKEMFAYDQRTELQLDKQVQQKFLCKW